MELFRVIRRTAESNRVLECSVVDALDKVQEVAEQFKSHSGFDWITWRCPNRNGGFLIYRTKPNFRIDIEPQIIEWDRVPQDMIDYFGGVIEIRAAIEKRLEV